jgi:hypothetical protein
MSETKFEAQMELIPRSGGYNTQQLAAESGSKACFVVNTRD